MTRPAFSLPDDLSDWAEARAAEERLGSAGDYLAELLRRDRAEAQKRTALLAAVDEGLASPVVDTSVESIIARGRARHGIA